MCVSVRILMTPATTTAYTVVRANGSSGFRGFLGYETSQTIDNKYTIYSEILVENRQLALLAPLAFRTPCFWLSHWNFTTIFNVRKN